MSFPYREASYLYNGAHCSDVAVASYHDADHSSIRHWPNRRMFEVGAEQGVVVWNDTDAVIGIAGTNDAYDMLNNVDARYTQVGPFGIHTGFLKASEVVAAALGNLDIPSFVDKAHTWWLTGHSKAGAVASILPVIMDDLNPERIFTFASPRCFKSENVGLYDYPVCRFDHPNDLVPDVPLHGRLGILKRIGGWRHVGKATYIWQDGTIDTENGHRLRRIARHVWLAKSIRPSKLSRVVVEDHSMENVYARSLEGFKRSGDLMVLREAA